MDSSAGASANSVPRINFGAFDNPAKRSQEGSSKVKIRHEVVFEDEGDLDSTGAEKNVKRRRKDEVVAGTKRKRGAREQGIDAMARMNKQSKNEKATDHMKGIQREQGMESSFSQMGLGTPSIGSTAAVTNGLLTSNTTTTPKTGASTSTRRKCTEEAFAAKANGKLGILDLDSTQLAQLDLRGWRFEEGRFFPPWGVKDGRQHACMKERGRERGTECWMLKEAGGALYDGTCGVCHTTSFKSRNWHPNLPDWLLKQLTEKLGIS